MLIVACVSAPAVSAHVAFAKALSRIACNAIHIVDLRPECKFTPADFASLVEIHRLAPQRSAEPYGSAGLAVPIPRSRRRPEADSPAARQRIILRRRLQFREPDR